MMFDLLNQLHSPLFLVSFWETIWLTNSLSGQFIILFILFLLGISVWLFKKDRDRIAMEISALRRVEQNMTRWKKNMVERHELVADGDNHDEDIELIYEASIQEDLMPGLPRNTLVYERLKVLDELRTTKSRLNIGVLQQLSELQDDRQLATRLPPYIMTLSMLLGMLGTYIGLTDMVGHITGHLSGFDELAKSSASLETFKNSFQGIQGVMKGVGTAFTTTLAGLFTTIVVSILHFIQNSRKTAFFDRFEQFTVKELLPNTFPDMEEKEAYNAIREQLRETFDQLNYTMEKNRKTLGTIDGLYEKFDKMVDTVKHVLSTGGTAELQTVLHEMTHVNDNLEKIIDKYENRKLLDDFQNLASVHEGYLNKQSFILEQSKWLPNARAFMILISALLGIIAIMLCVLAFS